MANRERGEFRLVAGEKSYLLRITTNACCELEDLAARPLDSVISGANRGHVRDVRLILWAALREHHPELATDDKDSLKAVGTLIDAAGGLSGILAQVKALIALNADSGEKGTGGAAAAGARPPHAQGGTGVSTTLTPSVSA